MNKTSCLSQEPNKHQSINHIHKEWNRFYLGVQSCWRDWRFTNILDSFSGGYAIAHPRLNATNDTPRRGVSDHIDYGIPHFSCLVPHASSL